MEKTPKQSPWVPVLIIGVIALSFIAGSLWQKVKVLEKGSGSGTVAGAVQKENYLSTDNLKKYAKDLKLDTKKFDQCLDSSEKKAQIDKELSEGEKEGVSGTPGFFLNGRLIAGAIPFEMFKTLIDYELSIGFDSGKPLPEEIQKLVDQGIIQVDKKEVNTEVATVKGSEKVRITLVEYSDFECPFCTRAYPTVKQILQTYPNDVRLVYKQFPLRQIHSNAQKAAEASLCALDQGKFWEYHDNLFDSASKQQ